LREVPLTLQALYRAIAPEAEAGPFKLSRKRWLALVAAGAISAAAIAALIYERAGYDAPDVRVLQSAYDSEGSSGAAGHDANLLVIDALCYRRQQPGLFYCIVAFTDRRDPDRRQYYDIAEVSAERGGWQLKSGLCKR
jgi:hypothetical protein